MDDAVTPSPMALATQLVLAQGRGRQSVEAPRGGEHCRQWLATRWPPRSPPGTSAPPSSPPAGPLAPARARLGGPYVVPDGP